MLFEKLYVPKKTRFATTLIIICIIATIDILFPLGVGIGMLHVLVLLFNRKAHPKRITIYVAVSVSLMVAKYVIQYQQIEMIIALNRLVQILVVLFVASILITINKTERKVTAEKEQILHMISHKIRIPVAHCKGLADLLERYPLTPEEKEFCLKNIAKSANELDQLTKELSNFVYGTKTQKISIDK